MRNRAIDDVALEKRAAAAAAVAREAGQVARRLFRSPAVEASFKQRGDIVTSADRAVDDLIADRLAAQFPADGRMSEESEGPDAAGLWVVDPIDGTSNFLRGIPHFAVSIAFVLENQTEIGVVYDPMADDLFVARRDRGAWCNGRRLRVSTPDRTIVLIEIGHAAANPTAQYVALVRRLLDGGYAFCQAGSAALGLAYVAEGRLDAYCELSLHAWDVLAGLLIVREAGGWTSDFPLGAEPRASRPVLASAADLADSLRAATGLA